ncbi:leucine-rich repeat-containing protein 29 [Suricata suricatta]|uniref:leucine-rich repeat-containing protein 29 n=1 Tax=Suricata suricatta TaxID=37032 RepID=UPI001155EA6F|nr:leucine-rich repeat-containing protein 29 [Suricata suricatta]
MSSEGPITCGQWAASAHTFSRGWEYSQGRYFRNFHLHPSCPSQSRPLSSSKLLLVSHPTPPESLSDHLRTQLRRNLRNRSFFPQLHQELELQASSPKDPSPQPQGPSLLMLWALQELDLTACSKLTDASLVKVLQFPQLRQLSLSLLPALTDKGLVAVAKGCPSLERLLLSHCSLLSDEGWAQAASFWPRLQYLSLYSCSQLTEQTLDMIGQA